VPEGYYDLLVVDAFSGDSVPVHLLTVEAIFEFMGRLTEKGIILFHISNRYLDLEPVLFSNAKALGLYVCADSNNNSHNGEAYASRWVALTRDAQTFEKLTSQLKWNRDVSYKTTKDIRPWTDKYSNLLSIFVFQNLSSQIKDFQPFYWSFDLNRRSRIDAEYYSTQGNFYYSQGNIEQAMAYYKKAMALDPRVYNARVMYDLLGKSKQAVINLQKALDKNPKDAASYIELGHIYQNLKQDEKAIASYKKAIELNPKNIEAYRGIGNAYKNMKQYQQAIENYKKIVQLDPQALDAYNEIGFNYYSLGQLQEAVVYFEKAITINPGHAAAYYNLGMLYNNSGQRQKARENLQKAKDLLTSSNDTQLRNKIEDLLSRL
jgi:tetratricopeptide (TPR) repeat protein